MNPSIMNSDLKQLRTAVSQQRFTIMGLAGAVVMCLLIMALLVGRERTIVVPPVIEKSFWVTHDKVSGTYLEQMAAFICYLILDVSPQSISWKKNLLVQYSTVSNTGELESRQNVEEERLKLANAMTQFAVDSLSPNEKDMTVVIGGRLSTYINGHRTGEESKRYLAQFVYTGGRVHLSKFQEVTSEEAEALLKRKK